MRMPEKLENVKHAGGESAALVIIDDNLRV
jgi:hypothetical protein